MVADVDIVRERETRVRQYVKDLKSFANITKEDFRQKKERQYAVLHALQLAIEATIEIGNHICSDEALGVPATYADTFRILADNGVIDFELGEKLRRMARFRNRIVHLYWEVDIGQVYEILQNNLGDFENFLRSIEGHIG